ncbi:DUF1553 domain-containing protein [Aureliella helgolandensis]|uniref:DUF1553 domain-containing protein n=1 Tax=Aureliella helgolandensis TaxID=2527968 RepID=A0A518G100_9BACT|nr:DUF1553 domain-containing protein [Aureliella helgolandensis]QDV22285.1 hypothetical protein Q31a_05690 [Aureliella helgolandensis]
MVARRRLIKRLLMGAVVLTALLIVAATLRRRTRIQPPQQFQAAYQANAFAETLQNVNQQVQATIGEAELEWAPAADNLTIARRLSLALVGSGLSLEEVQTLAQVKESDQIRWWTSYLLEDRRWSDYFADRFSRAYVGTNDGPFLLFRRRKFNAWLSQQFSEGRAYDQIVSEMLSAEGLWTDTPQVNFITATMDDANEGRGDPIRLAGRVSRVFLAQRVDCLQCHDDYLGNVNFGSLDQPVDGAQTHFHELAAFFAGTAMADPVFRGIVEDEQEYQFEYLGESETQVVAPNVPFAQDLLPDDGKPRQRLARWVTHTNNRAFSRATVNRVWALMFSRPLVTPVDNVPLDDTVPAVMDTLAEDFVNHRFDLKRLIRLIAESDAFRRASRAPFEITEAHEACWSVFPVTQLRPEQVAGSMLQACKLTALDGSSSIFTRLKAYGDTQDFLKRFGDRGEDEFDGQAVTIPQRLVLMNGKLATENTNSNSMTGAASRIATLVEDDQQAVQLIFVSALNRMPSETELSKFVVFMQDKQGNARRKAIGDIYWAILNSTEFSWNH